MSSIYKRNGVWQIQFKDLTGKTFQRSLHTRTKAEAKVMQKEVDRQMGGARRAPATSYPSSVQPYLIGDLVKEHRTYAEEYPW